MGSLVKNPSQWERSDGVEMTLWTAALYSRLFECMFVLIRVQTRKALTVLNTRCIIYGMSRVCTRSKLNQKNLQRWWWWTWFHQVQSSAINHFADHFYHIVFLFVFTPYINVRLFLVYLCRMFCTFSPVTEAHRVALESFVAKLQKNTTTYFPVYKPLNLKY